MGREVRRVPIDFDWPLNEVWKGFLQPDTDEYREIPCPDCVDQRGHSSGCSPRAQELHDQWYGYAPFDPATTGSRPWTRDDEPVRALATRNVDHSPDFYCHRHFGRHISRDEAINLEADRLARECFNSYSHHLSQEDVDALVDGGRLWDFTRRPLNDQQRADVEKKMAAGGNSWLPYDNGYRPTAEEVNRWSIGGMGHDGINQMIVIRDRCAREGVPSECGTCKGYGSTERYPGQRDKIENWEATDPPVGEGWQLWETVSEGSPISPVFPDREGLIGWLMSPAYTWGASQPLTREQAEGFVDAGWAISLAVSSAGVIPGEQLYGS